MLISPCAKAQGNGLKRNINSTTQQCEGRVKIHMSKAPYLIYLSVLLSACGTMPGMQNLDTSTIQTRFPSQKVVVDSALIPITPALLACQPVTTYHYRVAPADVLNINVWQHPEFDFVEKPTIPLNNNVNIHGAAGQTGYLVNSNGQINFPLLGYISVQGKTVEAIHGQLVTRLKRFIPDPQISVRVADYRGQKVYITGEVIKPGFLPITDQPLTIADALALSGWINPNSANPRYIYVIRGDFLAPQIYWLDAHTPDKLLLARSFSLRPKDILHVSTAPITQWNRFIDQLFPSIQPLMYTQTMLAAGV